MIKSHAIFRCLLAIAVFAGLHPAATGATLQAKVIEVESGNSLIVTNTSRPLHVRLKAVVPPDSRQPFSEAARDHLKALLLNQTVMVEYTHLSEGYLDARVFLNGTDIGSQMLRDGAAWYDRALEYTLSPADRELYSRCEQLAREEKRGLWQDTAPVSPWDFRKSQQVAKAQTDASFNSVREAKAARAESRSKSFSNTDLVGGMVGPGSVAGNPTFKEIWPNSAPGTWRALQAQAPQFTIRIPANSYQFDYPILDAQKKIAKIYYIVGDNEDAVYTVMWTSAADDGSSDMVAADDAIQGFVGGMNSYYQSKGSAIRAVASEGRLVKVGAYAGKQYTLTSGLMSGVARIITRRIGGQREMIALAVLGPGSEWVGKDFLNSLKLGAK
ncbi:MAG TPA: thermonuclease family protein [Pyrinomonadaceae bacterium]